MKADWSDSSHGRTTLSWDSYATAGVVNEQIFPAARPEQRDVPRALHLPRASSTATWRDRDGYSNDAVLQGRARRLRREPELVEYRFEKKNPDDEDFTALGASSTGVDLTGTAQRQQPARHRRHPRDDQLRGGHGDRRAHRLDQQELLPQPGPGHRSLVDHPLGPRPHVRAHGCCGVNSNFVTPAEPR